MILTLNANPGQSLTLMAEVVDGYGARTDPVSAPIIEYILRPSGAQLYGTLTMTRLSTGIYQRSISLPASVTGTYLASIIWADPDYGVMQSLLYMINVGLPFGNSFVTPS